MNLQDFFENIDRAQQRVKQLPADFRPPQTSPQLAGAYPGRNATRGYLVGEDQQRLDELLELTTEYVKLNDGSVVQIQYRPMLNRDPLPGSVRITPADPRTIPDPAVSIRSLESAGMWQQNAIRKAMASGTLNKLQQTVIKESKQDSESVTITFSPDDIEVVERAAGHMPDALVFQRIIDDYEKQAGIDRQDQAVLDLKLSSSDRDAIETVINKFGYRLDETGIFKHIMAEFNAKQGVTEAVDPGRRRILAGMLGLAAQSIVPRSVASALTQELSAASVADDALERAALSLLNAIRWRLKQFEDDDYEGDGYGDEVGKIAGKLGMSPDQFEELMELYEYGSDPDDAAKELLRHLENVDPRTIIVKDRDFDDYDDEDDVVNPSTFSKVANQAQTAAAAANQAQTAAAAAASFRNLLQRMMSRYLITAPPREKYMGRIEPTSSALALPAPDKTAAEIMRDLQDLMDRPLTNDEKEVVRQEIRTAQNKGVSETSDYSRRREREEAIIGGQKPARKKRPAQTSDYAIVQDKALKEQQGVAEAGYNPRDLERREQQAMDQERAQFKKDELEAELGGEEQRAQTIMSGTWYVIIDGRVWQRQGQPVTFRGRDAARRAGQTIKNRDPQKTVTITTQLPAAKVNEQDYLEAFRATVAEGVTSEDVLSSMKRKLGDYLQDVATAIRKDPDLIDKIPKQVDQIGPAVRTLKTDDGHEIRIHGNEDDGFRISIRGRSMESRFSSIAEAEVATEMYLARRRDPTTINDDYVQEKSEHNLRKTARTQRMMSQLRARYPQAETDLEALLYDFRAGQRQDRQDINRLDNEIDSEEEQINQIQQKLDDLKRSRGMQEAARRDPSPGKITKSEDPCWSGYHMVGTKKKAGRTVPNCVPGKKGS